MSFHQQKVRLIIAEKPSVAISIAKELKSEQKNDGYIICKNNTVVTWVYGHILEMAEPEEYLHNTPTSKTGKKMWRVEDLPIFPTNWIIKPVDKTKKQLHVIERLLKTANEIIHAGDPDREGQLLIDEVLNYFNNKKPVKRFWVSAQDPKSIQQGLNNLQPNSNYKGLSQAALARQRIDWLIGMNLSRAYTLNSTNQEQRKLLITVGRVQTPTLMLVVNRDQQIKNFKPVTFYNLMLDLKYQDTVFRAKWIPVFTENNENDVKQITDKKILEEVIRKIANHQNVEVNKYTSEEKVQKQPLCFSLADITALASNKYGYTAKETLEICQNLYSTHKIISYPRTDCGYLPESQFNDAKSVFYAITTNNNNLSQATNQADPTIKSNTWNDKKVTAHHGIIPTSYKLEKVTLTKKEKIIYDLICRQYLAQFYPEHKYLSVKIITTVNTYYFISTGNTVTQNGWKSLFIDDEKNQVSPKKTTIEKLLKNNEDTEQRLPKVNIGTLIPITNSNITQGKTKAPAKFTEGTLIQAMENIYKYIDDEQHRKILKEGDGIGTSATRAEIINELKIKELLELQGRFIVSTPLAWQITKIYSNNIKSPVLTAVFERALKEIQRGTVSIDQFLDHQQKFIKKEIEYALTLNNDKFTS